jgi:hypothetical protein
MAEPVMEKKQKMMEELDGLRIYVNDLLAKVNDRMKLSVHQYKSDWATHNPFSPQTKKREKLAEELKKAQEAKRAQEALRLAAAQTQTPTLAQMAHTTT